MPEVMWAPWRMEYILAKKGGPCIFCDYQSRDRASWREALVLAVTAHAVVCLNRYPFAAGHLLVAPRRHVADFSELAKEEWAGLTDAVRETSARVRTTLNAQGLNVGFNLGAAAGAGIADHLHAHVVPRWVGDTNFMPVLADVRVMPEHLGETWRKLEPAFVDLR
jgi:ATP adenylyltransferase